MRITIALLSCFVCLASIGCQGLVPEASFMSGTVAPSQQTQQEVAEVPEAPTVDRGELEPMKIDTKVFEPRPSWLDCTLFGEDKISPVWLDPEEQYRSLDDKRRPSCREARHPK